MIFSKKTKQSTASTTFEDNPYLRAKDEWFERYGNYIESKENWRVAAVLSLLLCILSFGLNIYQLQQNKITPYIIEVDKLGNAAAIKPLQENTEVPRRLMQAEIANVISNWRTVTADIELQKKLISKLNSFIGGSARGTMREWFEQNNPYSRCETILVSVDITGMPLPVSADSWRVSWRETIRNHSGSTLEVLAYEATLSTIIVPPKDEMQIINNPGGVLITSVSFSKILN